MTAMVTRPDGSRAQTALGEEAPGELSGAIVRQPGTYYIEVKSAEIPRPVRFHPSPTPSVRQSRRNCRGPNRITDSPGASRNKQLEDG